MTLDFASMTWKCNVCGGTRPDALIGVAKRQGPIPTAIWNIRFCLDRPACAEYAQQNGEWTGPADWYKVAVACRNLDIKDLNRIEEVAHFVPYDVVWTSYKARTRSVVHLAAVSSEAAARHVLAALRGGTVDVDQDDVETSSVPRRR